MRTLLEMRTLSYSVLENRPISTLQSLCLHLALAHVIENISLIGSIISVILSAMESTRTCTTCRREFEATEVPFKTRKWLDAVTCLRCRECRTGEQKRVSSMLSGCWTSAKS